MTAIAMALVFAGVLLMWAGITDQNIPAAIKAILSGNNPPAKAKP